MSNSLPPDPTADQLTTPQRTALTLIVRGSNMVDAAAGAGVHRGTLHRWIKSDPVFRAVYNMWLQESRENARAKLVGAASDAVACVTNSIRNGNHRLAYQLLKDLGMLSKIQDGLTDPHLLKQQMDRDLAVLQQSFQPPAAQPALPDPNPTPNQ